MELGHGYCGYEEFVFPGGNMPRQWTCVGVPGMRYNGSIRFQV